MRAWNGPVAILSFVVSLATAALLFLWVSAAFAGQVQTFTVNPCPTTGDMCEFVPSRPLISLTTKGVEICLSFTGFDDPAQILSYEWQLSSDAGVTWQLWFPQTIGGGPHYDRRGNLLTQYCAAGPPTTTGPWRLRMLGYFTSPSSMQMTINIASR